MKRKSMCEAQRRRILEENNHRCAYCGSQANAVDHIVPYAYTPENKDKNLVAACSICNSIAGDQVFDNFIAKQSYILEERQRKKWQRRIARQIEIPIPIESKREIGDMVIERPMAKTKLAKSKPLRSSTFPIAPAEINKRFEEEAERRRIIREEQLGHDVKTIRKRYEHICKMREQLKELYPNHKFYPRWTPGAEKLADLIIRLYDNKEDCMEEIRELYKKMEYEL